MAGNLKGGSAAISPTAHYTGYVWARNGLSHPELATGQGRALFETLRPAMAASRLLGGPTLEGYLLARHQAIDDLLAETVETHGEAQVIEVACGLSPRGWRFARRYGDRLTYVEADLPGMAEQKRRSLERMGALSAHHRVVEMDALSASGPGSLAAVAEDLDRERPLVIITEGLLSYLERDQVLALWRRFATMLAAFPGGRYLSDLHLSADARGPHVQAFRLLLSAFVRGPVRLHFADTAEAEEALAEAGFGSPGVRPAASALVRIVDSRAT